MAKTRMINTRFWVDNYVSELNPVEKLLFLYFLTNTATNISGVYELPLRNVYMDTGVEKTMVDKILKRFHRDKKIFYKSGWVCIQNFIKHQNQNSPKIQTGIEKELASIPDTILEAFKGYGYCIDTLSHPNPNYNKYPNPNTPAPFSLKENKDPRLTPLNAELTRKMKI